MWRQLLGRSPLIEAGVRAAPHRDFAIAIGLGGEPFHHVMSVAGFISKRLKFATGIPAAADIDKCKSVTMCCEIGCARVVAVGNIWRQGKDNRSSRRRGRLLGFGQVERRVELDLVAHWDL